MDVAWSRSMIKISFLEIVIYPATISILLQKVSIRDRS